jgi:hypothetical protein
LIENDLENRDLEEEEDLSFNIFLDYRRISRTGNLKKRNCEASFSMKYDYSIP